MPESVVVIPTLDSIKSSRGTRSIVMPPSHPPRITPGSVPNRRWLPRQANPRHAHHSSHQLTTAFLFGTGDIVAQQAVDKRGIKEHDWVRTARLSLYGGTIFAPIVVNWYKVRR
ncbi:hypothetical protein AG1IA_03066 [Rhizoctonia solani AG-1 IA]|uniref:Uncharacterized protein n=1 Tax=Thanatephorus cucumeris (strain AG1-IA) TaxID=983506 RepID=L8X1D5_THACA|nr:hypothetical protein AG1IA_03066 [Rhizoctonia solani AG-1 IA]